MASEITANGTANGATHPPPRPTILLNTPDLSTSPYLHPVGTLLDDVFRWAHTQKVPGKELLPPSVRRLQSGPEQLVRELGPSGFCVIMFDNAIGGKIIATASAKPYAPTKAGTTYGSDLNMLFKRAPVDSGEADTSKTNRDTMDTDVVGEDVENQSRWELLAFATDVSLMGQGIAGVLTQLVETEIRRRAAEEGKGKVVLMLSTMREMNEAYYLRRGWRTMSVKAFEPGTGGSRDGFSILEMVKVLD